MSKIVNPINSNTPHLPKNEDKLPLLSPSSNPFKAKKSSGSCPIFNRIKQLAKDQFTKKTLSDSTKAAIKPVASSGYVAKLSTFVGGSLFTVGIISALTILPDLISNAAQTVKGYMMLHNGLKILKKSKNETDSPQLEGKKQYGKDLRNVGSFGALYSSMAVLGSSASLLKATTALAIQIKPLITTAVSTAGAIGGFIAVPVTLALSSWNIKRNIHRIQRTTSQINVIKEELAYIQMLKENMGIKSFRDTNEDAIKKYGKDYVENLKQREEFLVFAERKIKDQRVNYILGLVTNILMLIGASFILAGLLTGPGALILTGIGLSLLALGGFGDLIVRSSLGILRSKRKNQLNKGSQEFAYSSSEVMRQKAKEIVKNDSKVNFELHRRKPREWTNGEWVTFLLMRTSNQSYRCRHKDPNEVRYAFLEDDKFYWNQMFNR